MQPISADAGTLMNQAVMTAKTYLIGAKKEIDDVFGDGYAEAHPELVSAFLRTCAADFGAAVAGAIAQDTAESLAGAIREIADNMNGGAE